MTNIWPTACCHLLAGGEAGAAKRAAKRAGHLVDWGRATEPLPTRDEPEPSHPMEQAAGRVQQQPVQVCGRT